MLKRILCIAGLLMLLGGGVVSAQQTTPASMDALMAQAQRDGEITVIVGLAAGTQGIELPPDAITAQQAEIQSARAGVISSLAGYGVEVVSTSTEWQIPYVALRVDAAGLAALAENPQVTSIEANQEFRTALAGTVPLVNADDVWNLGYTGAGQAVVVIDSGIERAHGFFGGRVVAEACFSGGGNAANSLCPNLATSQTGVGASDPSRCVSSGFLDCNHGTHVAGIAAGSGGSFSGVARGANIIGILAASKSSGAVTTFTLSDVVSSLNYAYALRNSYSIASVNMSLAGQSFTSYCDNSFPSLRDAILNLRGARIATVIATGNDGYSNAITTPSCISSAISVGATNDSNTIASFSNRHPIMTLFAPGVDVTSSYLNGLYGSMSGTSQATPHVAGAAALLKQAKPSMTVTEFKAALENTGPQINIAPSGSPVYERRLDVLAAYNWVMNQLVTNNDFSGGSAGWATFPAGALTTRIQSGVYELYRNLNAPSASLIQQTGIPVPAAGTRLEVRALLGNSSGIDQRISFLLHDSDFSDIHICSYWLPANTPLNSYLMRFRTSDPWTNATVSIYPAQPDGVGWLRVDDVLVNVVTGDWNYTVCYDPLAPGATGTDSANLLNNSDFSATVPPPSGNVNGNWWTFGQISWQQVGGVFNLNRLQGTPAGLVAQNSADTMNADTMIEAEFWLGNSSSTRGQMTVIVHDNDFTDMNVCTFWIPGNRALQPYTMFLYAREAWTNATISFYPRTVFSSGAFLLDNVTLRRRSLVPYGTECYPYDLGFSPSAVRADGSLDIESGMSFALQDLMPTLEPTATPMLPPGELPILVTPAPLEASGGEGGQTEGQLSEGG